VGRNGDVLSPLKVYPDRRYVLIFASASGSLVYCRWSRRFLGVGTSVRKVCCSQVRVAVKVNDLRRAILASENRTW